MSGAKENVFEAVRAALAGIDSKTPMPDYEDVVCIAEGRLQGGTAWESFSANFRAVNGRAMSSVGEVEAFLREHGYARGYCDPALRETVGDRLEKAGLEVIYEFERERYDEYAFGITRASGAIAESGTVILNDFDTSDRLAALTPWVHVAVLADENRVHRTLPDAIAAMGDCPNVVWATGPSKTADVEGILIEGVHGPGEQICLCLGAGA